MTYIILVIVVIIISFVLQFHVAQKETIWPSWLLIGCIGIPSMIFLVYNINEAFASVHDFGDFLVEYGGNGVVALVLKSGLIMLPTTAHIFLFKVLHNTKSSAKTELDKMIASDI